MRTLALAWVCGGALACGPVVGVPQAESTSSDAVVTTTTTTAGGEGQGATTVPPDPDPDPDPDPTTTPGSTSTATTVSSDSSDEDPSVGFIQDPDGGGLAYECALWAQDCPPGEKCMPWANDGGGSWNATRCTPIDRDPKEVGEPCTVVESGVSGIDDCVQAAMCWNVDPDTNMGECVAFCEGNEANPTCADACNSCYIWGDGPLILCLSTCDPIAQDCSEGQACYPIDDAFSCAPDVSGEDGEIGDPCEFINVCDPGNFCANAEVVPGCDGASSCCAPFCNVDAPDGCDALLPGTTCVPWYEEGQRPQTCWSGVAGACVVMP